jgi:hypothetical protein
LVDSKGGSAAGGSMIYFLGLLLVIAGFGLGWTTYPIVLNYILDMDCHCGSGNCYSECCALELEED